MRSLVIGRDIDVIHEDPEQVELVGRVRLRPGFVVEIAQGPARRAAPKRSAMVRSWRIRVLGSNGPIYRGVCRWCPSTPAETSELRAIQKGTGPTP